MNGVELDPWDVADLAALPELADWAGDVEYGASLGEALAGSEGFLSHLTVRAVLAGHAPIGPEGIRAVLAALHAYNLAESRRLELQEADADALVAIDPNAYRELIVLLEGMLAEAELRTSELHRIPPQGTGDVAVAEERRARYANARATRALERIAEVRAQIDASVQERGWR
jgi:hypothetical protein